MEDKIDIHNTDRVYETALRKFEADEGINPKNRELILKFLWDCKMGKTIKARTRKKLGKRRILKYLFLIKRIAGWLGKPLNEVSQEEMERFVFNIEEGFYKNKGKDYSERTKLDFKKALQKFYKWMGKPELVDFIDMTDIPKEVPAITREELEKMINSTHETSVKAALIVLFDGGPRAEELLNVRLKDLTQKTHMNDTACYWINIRHSKTFARTIPLPLSTKQINEWMAEHPDKNNAEAQLFPYTYPALRKRIRILGERALKKRLTLHMLRHSSATYWAPKLNRYQLCAKYGWAFSSDMPDRYIKRKGIIFDEIAEKGDVDQATKLQRENRILKDDMEKLQQDYGKIRKALEFLMPLIEDMEAE
ncbi:MAG: site-specific integrase, partial [Nanoarchaeota archaeon]|nr:site-specific integrase [Nanoarchaeota archaeon]